jgi:8-oxo-dGTP diphosphatase
MPNPRTILTARLLLEKDAQRLYLVQTAKNGGGHTLVGGKIEAAEFAKAALIRETQEEIGISLKKKHLTLVHVLHKLTPNTAEVIFFFHATQWTGEPKVLETLKFSHVTWTPSDVLPSRLPLVLRYALGKIAQGKIFSQYPKSKNTKPSKDPTATKTKTKSVAKKENNTAEEDGYFNFFPPML